MSHDLLSEATRALREADEVSELEARATRARVLSSLHQTRVTRRTRWVFVLPVAASFLAVSAWGASGGRARHVLDSIEQLITPAPKPPSSAPSRKRATLATAASAPPTAVDVPGPLPAPVESPLPAGSPSPMPLVAPRPFEPVPALNAPPPVRGHAASLSSARGPEPSAPDRTLELYRTAHTAHFVDRDPLRALAGWDAYLSAAPNGPFAPEARYNRALSLVRLGRSDEARRALHPFANGAFGGYRQAEASALLRKLEQVHAIFPERALPAE